jgi:hypothetical protein
VASRKSAGKWKVLSQFPDVVLGKLGDLGTSILPVHASETGSTNQQLTSYRHIFVWEEASYQAPNTLFIITYCCIYIKFVLIHTQAYDCDLIVNRFSQRATLIGANRPECASKESESSIRTSSSHQRSKYVDMLQ